MADKLSVVTGASGFLGSHIVEQLVAHGERVRAVVRLSRAPFSGAAAFLKRLGVEIANAELADRPALRKAVAGAAIVYHCAARVTDWGPWRAFKADTIERELTQSTRLTPSALHASRMLRAPSMVSALNARHGPQSVTRAAQ